MNSNLGSNNINIANKIEKIYYFKFVELPVKDTKFVNIEKLLYKTKKHNHGANKRFLDYKFSAIWIP